MFSLSAFVQKLSGMNVKPKNGNQDLRHEYRRHKNQNHENNRQVLLQKATAKHETATSGIRSTENTGPLSDSRSVSSFSHPSSDSPVKHFQHQQRTPISLYTSSRSSPSFSQPACVPSSEHTDFRIPSHRRRTPPSSRSGRPSRKVEGSTRGKLATYDAQLEENTVHYSKESPSKDLFEERFTISFFDDFDRCSDEADHAVAPASTTLAVPENDSSHGKELYEAVAGNNLEPLVTPPSTLFDQSVQGYDPEPLPSSSSSALFDDQSAQSDGTEPSSTSLEETPPPLPPRPPRLSTPTTLVNSRLKTLLDDVRRSRTRFKHFDWTYSKETKRCAQYVAQLYHKRELSYRKLMRCFELGIDHHRARGAWKLLSPNANFLKVTDSRLHFLRPFFHLHDCDRPSPYQVPVSIRVLYGHHQGRALVYENWAKGRVRNFENLAAKLCRYSDLSEQGDVLITFLELALEKEGPLQTNIYLYQLSMRSTLSCLGEADREKLSNMLATFVRKVRDGLGSWSDRDIFQMVDFLTLVLMLSFGPSCCTAQASLFRSIVFKLESVEISLCSWLFLEAWQRCHLLEVGRLVHHMEDRFRKDCAHGEDPWSLAAVNAFLLLQSTKLEHGHPNLFFAKLNKILGNPIWKLLPYGKDNFGVIWSVAGKQALYNDQVSMIGICRALDQESEKMMMSVFQADIT
ncbi:MAG: hypothetical protein M1836_003719 [Candelina mexicana]|nr:MAG: hypothetical protein M1836_003719 [Candelina mexicana]